MNRFGRLAALLTVLVVAMAFAVPASGTKEKTHEVPFKGTVAGAHGRFLPGEDGYPSECEGYDWYFFSSGTGHMSHLGKVDFGLAHCTSGVTGTLSQWQDGIITFTASNRDTLIVKETGEGELEFDGPGPPIGFTYLGEWVVDRGTGRFDGATGSGQMEGYGNIPGDLVIEFTGTIAYDASARSKK